MQKVIFVYNADSGLLNWIKDTGHKVVSKSTYQCNLCRITTGVLSTKDKWNDFISSLDADVEFMHKNDFVKKYGMEKASFPCAFVEKKSKLHVLISSAEINKCKNLDQLIKLVRRKVK